MTDQPLPYTPLPSTLVSKSADTDVPMNYAPLAPTLGMRTPPASLREQVHLAGTHDARVENHLGIGAEDLLRAPSWLKDTPGASNPQLGYHRLTNTTITGKPEVRVPCWRYHKVKAARLIKTEAELDALEAEWADTPFPPAPESVGLTVDQRLENYEQILEVLGDVRNPGESPVEAVERLVSERDAYAKAVAATVVAPEPAKGA